MTKFLATMRCSQIALNCIALALTAAFPSLSECALLSLSDSKPDITAGSIKVSYNASTNQFIATGDATWFQRGGAIPDAQITNSEFKIVATIDLLADGSLAILGGTLEVKGQVLGSSSVNTLLNGNLLTSGPLLGFGTNGKARFDFRFSNSDSTAQLASYFPGILGVKLDASSVKLSNSNIAWDGNFNKSFDNYLAGNPGYYHKGYKSASADINAEVPEPTTMTLWAFAGMLMVASRRRNSRL